MNPEEKMGKWLESRRTMYADLIFNESVKLVLPPQVREYLYAQIGEFKQTLANTVYPVFSLERTGVVDMEEVRKYLAPFNLTCYQSYFFSAQQSKWEDGLIVTPRVSPEVIDVLDGFTGVKYKEDIFSPCLMWEVNMDPVSAEQFLGNMRGSLKEYPVTPHLSFEIIHNLEYTEARAVQNLEISPTGNKFDLVRFHLVDGPNFGITTEDIIGELMLLDKQFGVDFITSSDVQFQRLPTPDELAELFSWYDNFCPDNNFLLSFDGMNYKENLSKGRLSFGWD